MRDSDLLRAAAMAVRDTERTYALVDRYYRDRGVDADAEDVARALDDAADSLDGWS